MHPGAHRAMVFRLRLRGQKRAVEGDRKRKNEKEKEGPNNVHEESAEVFWLKPRLKDSTISENA
jgi:hypothetical protein